MHVYVQKFGGERVPPSDCIAQKKIGVPRPVLQQAFVCDRRLIATCNHEAVLWEDPQKRRLNVKFNLPEMAYLFGPTIGHVANRCMLKTD
jgi:hypothetical protein